MCAATTPRRALRVSGLTAALVVAATTMALGVAAAPAAPTPPPVVGFGWGADAFGQLGPGVTGTYPRPVPLTLPAGTTTVALGQDFTLAQSGSALVAWGRNDEGQLGDGTNIGRTAPASVEVPPVKAISADDRHAVVVTTSGQVYAWGDNSAGELGDGTTIDRNRPVRVTLPTSSPAVAVGTGSTHTLVATADGAVYAWGQGADGQLGDGSTASSSTPVPTRLPGGATVVALAAGARHSLALTSAGTVLAWGSNDRGQLGTDGADTPVPTALSLTDVAAVVTGSRHSAALTRGGTVMAWGGNDQGQLGDGSTTDRRTPVPVRVPPGLRIASLSVVAGQSVALATDGRSVLTWGTGTSGQLGDGGTNSSATPALVALDTEGKVLAAEAGSTFDIVVTDATPAPAPTTTSPTSPTSTSTPTETTTTSTSPATTSAPPAPATSATTPLAPTSASTPPVRGAAPVSGPGGSSGGLAGTGASGTVALVVAGLLTVFLGGVLLMLSRRRRAVPDDRGDPT